MSTLYKVDLNSDLGESFGNYKIGRDEDVIPLISSANIACGYHASDPLVMDKTVRIAQKAGIAAGAHPGFPDLMGFGRRNMAVSHEEAKAYVLYQLGALDAFMKTIGLKMQHVKPHGAFYNMAAKDPALAEAICIAVKEYNPELIILALYGGELEKCARSMGLRAASEFFADRAYEDDGSLVNRRLPGAVIHDEELAIARTVKMVKEQKVTTIHGTELELNCCSVCVHGDNEKALAFVRRIREAFTAEGIEIAPLREIV